MSGITASAVNDLRKKTGAGMMDCKKALQESNGDMEAAVDYLRKKGQKISAKRADRDATEGAVIAKSSDDGSYGIIIRLNSETDFVAKNEDFVKLAHSIADVAVATKPADLESLKAQQLEGKAISELLIEQMGKIGEKIEVSAYELVESPAVSSYIHAGNKLGVLVALNQNSAEAIQAGKDVAMQIAAMNPLAVDKEDVDANTVKRELEIGMEQARAEGKPEAMLEKIAQGKLGKFYKESTLNNQSYVKDPSLTVSKMLDGVSTGLKVTAFKRVALG